MKKSLAVAGVLSASLLVSSAASPQCMNGLCPGDLDASQTTTIDELVRAVNAGLKGCDSPDVLCGVQAPPNQTVITEVFVDIPTPDLVTIEGRNLDGQNLEVMLGEFPGALVLVSTTPNEIVAELPSPLPNGDYLLAVATGNGPARLALYDLTIGAVGPPGAPGEPGEPGEPGPAGSVPTGAIILWDQSSDCPTGFARASEYDAKFLVGADSAGTLGGSNTHSHSGGNLTAPAHKHKLERSSDGSPPVDDNSGGENYNTTTNEAGGGAMTGTSGSGDSRPEFMTILLCRKS